VLSGAAGAVWAWAAEAMAPMAAAIRVGTRMFFMDNCKRIKKQVFDKNTNIRLLPDLGGFPPCRFEMLH
jgi:hypothetical protein